MGIYEPLHVSAPMCPRGGGRRPEQQAAFPKEPPPPSPIPLRPPSPSDPLPPNSPHPSPTRGPNLCINHWARWFILSVNAVARRGRGFDLQKVRSSVRPLAGKFKDLGPERTYQNRFCSRDGGRGGEWTRKRLQFLDWRWRCIYSISLFILSDRIHLGLIFCGIFWSFYKVYKI